MRSCFLYSHSAMKSDFLNASLMQFFIRGRLVGDIVVIIDGI